MCSMSSAKSGVSFFVLGLQSLILYAIYLPNVLTRISLIHRDLTDAEQTSGQRE